jgi:hypothetical protein
MRTKDMNEGVQILLARMKSHPDEFCDGLKWEGILDSLRAGQLDFLEAIEVKALKSGLKDMYRDRFTAKVLVALTQERLQRDLF